MSSPPFFIIGIGRSGTTLLRLMLHNHPRIAIPYESHFIVNYIEKIDDYGDLNDDNNMRLLLKDILNEPIIEMWDHKYDLDRVFNNIDERSIRGAIDAIYRDYASDKDKARWGDKSDYLDRIDLLNKVFPEAQFIHIIRDGRDVANSVIKMPWGPNDIIEAAEWWNNHVWVAHRMGAILGEKRYAEVHYEKLVENPESELKRLSAFLGEEYSPEMMNYHKDSEKSIPGNRKWHYNVNKTVNKARTYAWKREMSPVNVMLFDKYAGRMLKELGYECSPERVNSARVNLYQVKTFVARFFRHLKGIFKK